ncbi:MAG: hypothetical protein ACFFC7_17200 [Candidatus Hermodarchaeota archaeon]
METGFITQKYIARILGETEEEIKEGQQLLQRLYDSIRTGEDWEEISVEVRKKVKEKFNKLSKNQHRFQTVEDYLNSTYEGFVLVQGLTPMYKFFLNYEPFLTFKEVSCPVLLLFGELDIIHPPDHHKEVILNALKEGGNKSISAKVFPQTDHDFTTEDSIKKKDFAPEFLDTITSWILNQVEVVK